MSQNKSKLGFESKRTLLDQALQYVVCYSVDTNQPLPFFKFIKIAFINKSFLAIQSSARFDIYRAVLDFNSNQPISLFFEPKEHQYSVAHSMKLPFNRCYSLVKFLQPPQIVVRYNGITPTEPEELAEILKATNGRISLNVQAGNLQFDEFLRMFGTRLYELECDSEFLFDDDILLLGALDKLTVRNIETIGHFQRFLRCKVKSMELEICDSAYEAERFTDRIVRNAINDKSLWPKNAEIKHLCLNFNSLTYNAFQHIADKWVDCCSNISELKFFAGFCYKIPINELSNVAVKYCQYIQKLKEHLVHSNLKKFEVKFAHFLAYGREYNRNAVKSVCKNFALIEWQKTEEIYNERCDKLQLDSKHDNDSSICFLIQHPSIII